MRRFCLLCFRRGVRLVKRMLMPDRLKIVDLCEDEHGQATTEYAVLVLWTVILTYTAIKALEVSLLYYYQDIVSLICLPIP